jgi:hypothetical protein
VVVHHRDDVGPASEFVVEYRTSEVQYWCLLLAANGITLFSLVGPFGFSRP